MRTLIAFVLIASTGLLLVGVECLNQPVLSSLGITPPSLVPIGKVFNSADFKSELDSAFKTSGKQIDVVLVNDNQPIESNEFVNQIRSFEEHLDNSVVYQPKVNSAYSTLMGWLGRSNVKANKFEVNSLLEGFSQFVESHNQNRAVILLQKEQDIHQRKKRAATDNVSNVTRSYAFGDQCAVFFDSVTYVDESTAETSKKLVVLQPSALSFTCKPGLDGSQILTVDFQPNPEVTGIEINEISFQFQASSNGLNFFLNSSTLTLANQDTHPLLYMGAPYSMETPLNYSFACTRTPFMLRMTSPDPKLNLKVMIYFENLQLQPLGMAPDSKAAYTFGQVNYCQGFFSSGIWMGITSSLLLALILALGLTALMTIQTNDRLDDPKGKPLNIGVEK